MSECVRGSCWRLGTDSDKHHIATSAEVGGMKRPRLVDVEVCWCPVLPVEFVLPRRLFQLLCVVPVSTCRGAIRLQLVEHGDRSSATGGAGPAIEHGIHTAPS